MVMEILMASQIVTGATGLVVSLNQPVIDAAYVLLVEEFREGSWGVISIPANGYAGEPVSIQQRDSFMGGNTYWSARFFVDQETLDGYLRRFPVRAAYVIDARKGGLFRVSQEEIKETVTSEKVVGYKATLTPGKR